MVEDMIKFRLVQRSKILERKKRGPVPPRGYGQLGYSDSKTAYQLTITDKGKRFIKLIDGMTALMPKAPWVLRLGD